MMDREIHRVSGARGAGTPSPVASSTVFAEGQVRKSALS